MPSLFFGRGRRYLLEMASPERVGDDARLFALTFVGGFLFMTIYLA